MNDNGARLRIPPNSKESEMMVLGCMLTSINALNIGADSLDESNFYYTEHKIIFQVLKAAYKNDKPVDLHLVCEELKRQDKLKTVGGPGYVATLAQYAGTSAHIEEYCNLVRSKAMLRNMIHAAQTVEKKALEEPEDVLSSLDEAQQLFYQIGQSLHPSAGKLLGDILNGVKAESQQSYLKELEARQESYLQRGPNDPGITGLPTRFIDFDKMINGLGRSNLLILAARPAMGKTAFAINIAENVCFKQNVPVGVFSLEMSADQLVHRIICSQSEVESDKIRTGNITGDEFNRIATAVSFMQQHVMVIDDQPGLKITDLRARARRMRESYGIELLIVDYLQLLSGSGSARNMESRQSEISEISRMLKNLARELNIPIICLSQLSRKVEERPGHRPQMSDLRESGSIEQDADIIMFLLRREYYDPMDKPGMAELIIGKNRHGGIGTVNLTYRKELAQFSNFTPLKMEQLAHDSHGGWG
jgi:replicative DNA helicase